MKRLLIMAATLLFAAAMAMAQSSGGTSGASSTDQQTSGANSNSTGSYSQNANPTADSGDMSSQQTTNSDSSQAANGKHRKKTHKDNGTDVKPSDNKGVMGGDSSRENTSSPNANSSTLPGQKVSHPPDSNSQSNPDTNPHL